MEARHKISSNKTGLLCFLVPSGSGLTFYIAHKLVQKVIKNIFIAHYTLNFDTLSKYCQEIDNFLIINSKLAVMAHCCKPSVGQLDFVEFLSFPEVCGMVNHFVASALVGLALDFYVLIGRTCATLKSCCR